MKTSSPKSRRYPLSGASLNALKDRSHAVNGTGRGESTALTSPRERRVTQVRRNCTRASKAEVAPTTTTTTSRHSTVARSIVARMASSSSAPVREETYNGELYLVVPVVALLGNIVFWPSGAEGYEFVPDYVLSACPVGWNNRPVVPFHPAQSEPTANTPAFLAANCFGQLFNTIYESSRGNRDTTGKLKTEAWLNITRAAIVGQIALDVIDKCRNGELVEVSVGAQIAFEYKRGTYGGQEYVGIWRGLVPDHLAMGIAEGACNVETGCGGPRTASAVYTRNSNSKSKRSRSRSRVYFVNGGPNNMPRAARAASMLDSVKSLLSNIRLSATPAEDAEEAAELIAYGSMRDLVKSAISKLQAADVEIGNLISVETTEPTTTAEGESAEETIEIAQFQRIRTLLYSAGDDTYSASSIVYDLLNSHMRDKELEEAVSEGGATPVVIVGDTRYYAADGESSVDSRNAAGARHSKSDMKMIQSTHDMTAKLGATCGEGESETKTATKGEPVTNMNANIKPLCGCGDKPANLFSKLSVSTDLT